MFCLVLGSHEGRAPDADSEEKHEPASDIDTLAHIPVIAELQAVLDVAPAGMTFLITEQGRPFTPAGFGGWFRRRCNEAGLRELSAHGLRKAAATRLAEHGATAHELVAWFGWTTLREAERYTRAANRKTLAQGVAHKLKGRT